MRPRLARIMKTARCMKTVKASRNFEYGSIHRNLHLDFCVNGLSNKGVRANILCRRDKRTTSTMLPMTAKWGGKALHVERSAVAVDGEKWVDRCLLNHFRVVSREHVCQKREKTTKQSERAIHLVIIVFYQLHHRRVTNYSGSKAF